MRSCPPSFVLGPGGRYKLYSDRLYPLQEMLGRDIME